MTSRLLDHPKFYYALFVVLLVPALLINLGVHHLFVHTDESRRALVALEMILSGDFVSPTLNGMPYLNKPPLYNWIIAASFKLFHSYSAFAVRFPMVLSCLLFGASIIFFFKPLVGRTQAWLIAAATLTSGRILFYDSFLGLIDVLFSALIFINFMIWYRWGKSGRYSLVFCASYFLMAIAYLMKGLPPIVFQFFTLIAFAIFIKNWRFLFKPAHFLGIICFVLPVGAYYAIYFSQQNLPVADVVQTLWTESAKRTVADHSVWDTIISILIFPFENFYHFAPWTFFLLAFWFKQARSFLWKDDLSRFLILALALNIWIYWTSPGVHPRYLFMFLPLIFALCFKAIDHPINLRLTRYLQRFFGFLMIIGIGTPFALWNFANGSSIESFGFKMLLVFIGLGLLCLLFWRKPANKWIILGSYLLVIRVAFNWVVLPDRDQKGAAYAHSADQVVMLSEGKDLALLGANYVHDGTSFMISRAREEILAVDEEATFGKYYIVVDYEFDPERFESLYEFGTYGTDHTLRLVTLKSEAMNEALGYETE